MSRFIVFLDFPCRPRLSRYIFGREASPDRELRASYEARTETEWRYVLG
jgi:hypothetical protein